MYDTEKVFRDNLKRIRRSKKLTQSELAKLAGLSSGLVGDIESGRRNPTLKSISKIANSLDVPAFYLFYEAGMEKPKTDLKKQEIEKIKMENAIKAFIESDAYKNIL